MSRKDPYLYDDVDVLKNKGNIKEALQLEKILLKEVSYDLRFLTY